MHVTYKILFFSSYSQTATRVIRNNSVIFTEKYFECISTKKWPSSYERATWLTLDFLNKRRKPV